MDHIEVDGLRVAYQRRGDGPPLLLLHGAVCDSRVWRVELESFADDHTVVAWDAPGCGESSDPPEGYRMPDYARCLAGLIDALDLAPTHVLGHSWGSGLALELAHRRPELVNTLVLVGAYAGWAGSLPPEEIRRRLHFAHQLADSIPNGFDPRSMPGLFSDVMPPDRAEELAGIMADIRPAGTRTMADAFATSDQREMLGSIDAPTLLVYGDHDVRAPVEVGEALHLALAHSTLTVLPGLGHECFIEDAARFEAAVRSFLDGHRRTG
jgi:pimeloyl-ACP methyl ester carboxylesterase